MIKVIATIFLLPFLSYSSNDVDINKNNIEQPLDYDLDVSNVSKNEEMNSVIKEVQTKLKSKGYITQEYNSNISKRSIFDGKRVTGEFYAYDLREALLELELKTGVSFVVDEKVDGTIYANFSNTPLSKALDIMLSQLSLVAHEKDNYIFIMSPDLKDISYSSFSDSQVTHPVYMLPSEILSLFPEAYKQYIQVDDENNTIVTSGTKQILSKISSLIEQIDIRPTQIMLEVLVADISKSAKQKIGVDWWNSQYRVGDTSKLSLNTINPLNSSTTNNSNTGFGGIMLSDPVRNFKLGINALEETGEARIWATPKVLTTDGKKASINITSDHIIPIASGNTTYLNITTKVLQSGVKMNIRPRVSDTGEISLDIINAEVSTIAKTGDMQATGNKLPVLVSRNIQTLVVMKSNETLVIGGLLDISSNENNKNLPGTTGYNPIAESILGVDDTSKNTRELLIFITPKIIQHRENSFEKRRFL